MSFLSLNLHLFIFYSFGGNNFYFLFHQTLNTLENQ